MIVQQNPEIFIMNSLILQEIMPRVNPSTFTKKKVHNKIIFRSIIKQRRTRYGMRQLSNKIIQNEFRHVCVSIARCQASNYIAYTGSWKKWQFLYIFFWWRDELKMWEPRTPNREFIDPFFNAFSSSSLNWPFKHLIFNAR